MQASAAPPPPLPLWVPQPLQYPIMAAPPQFAPQHYAQFPPPGPDEKRTVWVGDLQFWMDEVYLRHCFAGTGEVFSVKVIRNKHTGASEGYGFVEFYTHSTAENVLQTFNGMTMPDTDMPFRLNWASFSMGDRRTDIGSDYSIFVGDLASDVTDSLLQETFSSKYPSVKGAKVVIDTNTGRSKGYGFVRFGDENEKTRAINEMNGVYCSSRPMRVGAATPRRSSGGFSSNASQGVQSDSDSSNTTVFVGGLDSSATEDDLRQAFAAYGEIASVKIPAGKQCGFVQFVNRSNAEDALGKLNGLVIRNQAVRLSWGRSPANRQVRADSNIQWNNPFYGQQVYSGYAYPMPQHNPAMYAAAPYGGYAWYGNQQQVS